MTNYLLFNVHNAGYSNQLLSLELALGISWLTGRELLLCGEGSDFKKLRSIKGGWFKLSSLNNSFRDSYWREPKNTPVYRESFIYEILSSSLCSLKCFNQSDLADNMVLDDLDVSKIRLSEHFFCSKEDLSSEHGADLIKQFGNGRHALTNSDSKYWHLCGSTLGFYSRFFYNKGQELWNHINSLRPNDLIMKTSQAISSKLGAFNGIHVRLTDFSKMHEPSGQYVDIISKCVGNLLRTGEKLLICTDESKDSLFWVNVLKKVDAKNCIFLDEFIVRECSYEISRLDWINESVWGALCQEIMKDSLIFMGTPGSTFTGLIHRKHMMRLKDKNAETPQYFTFCGTINAPAVIQKNFSDNTFLDCKSGHYSWNRALIPNCGTSKKSWYREWPECLI